MKCRNLSVLVLAGLLLLTSGCAVVSSARNAAAVYEGWRSFEMVKEFRDASPVFHGVAAVKVDSRIVPRDEAAEGVVSAFDENFHFLTDEALAATGIDVPVCVDDCPPDTLLIQFDETGFDGSVVERVTMGKRMRGDIFFIAGETGEVLDRVDLKSTEDYAGVADSLQGILISRMLASRQVQVREQVRSGVLTQEQGATAMRQAIDRANQLEPVRADLRAALAAN